MAAAHDRDSEEKSHRAIVAELQSGTLDTLETNRAYQTLLHDLATLIKYFSCQYKDIDIEDRISVVNESLILSVNFYDPTRGPFHSLFSTILKNHLVAMRRYWNSERRYTLRVAHSLSQGWIPHTGNDRRKGFLRDAHDYLAEHDTRDELGHRWKAYRAQLTPIELAAIVGPLDDLSFDQIAEANHCSAKRIDNARERAKEKRDLFLAGEGMRERMKEERRQSRNT